MARRLTAGRSPILVATLALVLACGSGTDAPSTSPTTTDDPGSGVDPSPGTQAVLPGPWAPSRALALDRFALETALGVALAEPAGAELSASTVWTLNGAGVELRLEIRTWLDRGEAEMQCTAAAGVPVSLALGAPSWTTADAVYVTRGDACVKVSVLQGTEPDVAGAGAVAAALLTGA